MNVFGVTGWKNTGKTTLVAKLVTEISARGFSVSTIKRSHHNVDLDTPGTDSHAHRSAGAQEVMLASDQRYAIMKELKAPPTLRGLIERMEPVDLVLVEGFKNEPHAKIECHQAGCQMPLIADENNTVKLIATNEPLDISVPQIDPEEISKIADFVMDQVNLTEKTG